MNVIDLGEIGHVPEKTWTRATPYSPALSTRTFVAICGIRFGCCNPIAFVNDMEQPEPPEFWRRY